MRSHYLELNVDSLMKDKKLEANLSMVASRVMAGLNMNGLKYLLPLWLGALTGVTIRCVFAAVAFWLTGCFIKEAAVTRKQRIMLFCLGAFGLYGFMFCYLLGISKTTPVSSAIFNSMQPIWVFLISVFFLHEKATVMKIIGIALGFGNKEQGKIIYSLFQNALHRITLNPFIGQATEVDNIRYITPCPDYTLFYRHSLLKIEILVLWDNSHKVGKIKSIPIGEQEEASKLL
jgi:uncharacterized membrane protein